MSSRELECTSPPVVSGCAERRRPGIHNHWTQFGERRLRFMVRFGGLSPFAEVRVGRRYVRS